MMWIAIAAAACIPLGLLTIMGAFGTWGWNERAGIVMSVMGAFSLIATIVVWEQMHHDECAAAGGIVLDFTCVEADAIIILK